MLRGGVDVGDYQAVTNYFPVRFRARTDPRRAIDPDLQGLERVPPRVDLTHGPQTVLLIGRARATRSVLVRPDSVRLLQQLNISYRLVATSRRSRLVEVWNARRPRPTSARHRPSRSSTPLTSSCRGSKVKESWCGAVTGTFRFAGR